MTSADDLSNCPTGILKLEGWNLVVGSLSVIMPLLSILPNYLELKDGHTWTRIIGCEEYSNEQY